MSRFIYEQDGIYDNLGKSEQVIMAQQLATMCSYLGILDSCLCAAYENQHENTMKDSVTLNTEDFYEIIRQAYLVGRKDEEDHYPIDTASMLSLRLNRLCNDLHIQIAEGMLPNKFNA